MRPGPKPILNLRTQESFNEIGQRPALDLIQRMNQRHMQSRDDDEELAARIDSYELAFRMQAAAPDLVDLKVESQETLGLYGIDNKVTQEFGHRCLLPRRMVERGVRFVQVYSGNSNGWDAHSDIDENHSKMCAATDRPVAGLRSQFRILTQMILASILRSGCSSQKTRLLGAPQYERVYLY